MKWTTAGAFGVLCGWQGSLWLLAPDPQGLSLCGVEGLGCLLVAVLALGWRGFRRSRWHYTLRDTALFATTGLLMFSVPAALLERAREYSPDANLTVCFAFAPVVVVVVWNAVSPGFRATSLVPALAGAAGVLLILPFELPLSRRGWESLLEVVAAMCLVAASSVGMHMLLWRWRLPDALLLSASANGMVLLLWAWGRGEFVASTWSGSSATRVLASAIAYVVAIFLLLRMAPVRFGARFLVIPAITLVEGIILIRPGGTLRMTVGMGLLIGGVIALFRQDWGLDNEVLSLR